MLKKMLKKKRFWFLSISLCAVAFVVFTLQHERFGAQPSGKRLARIEQSPNYKDGGFYNTMPDPTNLVRENFFVRMYEIHFNKDGRRTPNDPVPSIKTDLKSLDRAKNVVVPLGHSSFYAQVDGIRFLIDPVFADYAAPFSFMNRAFDGTNVYTLDDMPPIDYVLISHDHYDHLDYETMKVLRGKIQRVITPLGVGAHLEHWGYAPEAIWEGYWYDSIVLENDVKITILPARHYSSRLFERNKTLWGSIAITSPSTKIYYSADTGYGDHIKEIGNAFGGFDLVILDVGQFNAKGWPHIHMLPQHAATAAEELGAKRMLPAHNSKFAIALHDWDAPLQEIYEASKGKDYTLLTPVIGHVIDLDDHSQVFAHWWKNMQ